MLCSKHFQESDFESYGIRRKLKKGAVPSVSLYKVHKSRCKQKYITEPLKIKIIDIIARICRDLKKETLGPKINRKIDVKCLEN